MEFNRADTAVLAYSNPDAATAARRDVFMVKAPFKTYVMWDDIRGIYLTHQSAAFWLNIRLAKPQLNKE